MLECCRLTSEGSLGRALSDRSIMSARGALQPWETTFLVSGSLYHVLEIAAISVAVVTIW